jgi:tetratricopeptide (TPR) repeat protein
VWKTAVARKFSGLCLERLELFARFLQKSCVFPPFSEKRDDPSRWLASAIDHYEDSISLACQRGNLNEAKAQFEAFYCGFLKVTACGAKPCERVMELLAAHLTDPQQRINYYSGAYDIRMREIRGGKYANQLEDLMHLYFCAIENRLRIAEILEGQGELEKAGEHFKRAVDLGGEALNATDRIINKNLRPAPLLPKASAGLARVRGILGTPPKGNKKNEN